MFWGRRAVFTSRFDSPGNPDCRFGNTRPFTGLAGDTDTLLITDIRQRCQAIAEMPEEELEDRRLFFWEYARESYSQFLQ